MSKIAIPHFPMEIWAMVFLIFSLINFEVVYNWPIPKFGLECLVYNFFFYPEESWTLLEILFFFF